MPLPWPSELLPEAALLGFAMAVAGSLIGAWMGARLAADELPRTRSLRTAAVLASAAVAAMVGFALLKPAEPGISATVALQNTTGPQAGRYVDGTVTMSPRDAADNAEWLTATSWQGGGLVVDRLKRIGPGVYRTTQPIPAHGDWKTTIRLHHGNSLMAIPLYLPEDKAIPVKGVPATPHFTRTFITDHKLLQREQKTAAPFLWAIAYAVVLGIALSFLALLAWGIHRVSTSPVQESTRTVKSPRRQQRDASLTTA
jgi:hypothetical protein